MLKPAFIYVSYIETTPEELWEALTSSKFTTRYWWDTSLISDWKVGSSFEMVRGDGTVSDAGKVVAYDPPRLLSYTWIASWTGDVKTTVRWELEPANQGTLVRIRHSGLAAHPEVAQSYRGWPRMLGWLRAFLEIGETADDCKPVSGS